MERIEIIIKGRIPSKQEVKETVMVRKKRFDIYSKVYRKWETKNLFLMADISNDLRHPINKPCIITAKFQVKTLTCFSLFERFETIVMLLVRAKILKNDSYNVIRGVQLDFLGKTGVDETTVYIDYNF